MNKAVDFNAIRKRRQRTAAFKRLIALAGLMLLIGGALFLNNLLVEVSITTKISDFFQGFGGQGYPAPVPGGTIRDVKGMGGDLAVLCDNSVYVYNPSGKVIQTVPQVMSSAVLEVTSARMLVYSAGGKRFGLYSRGKPLYETEMEFAVNGGAVSESGDWAILTSDKQYLSKAIVYNSRGDEIYSWYSSEFMSAVALSDAADKLVVACVRTENGVLQSQLNFFKIGVDEVAARVELSDELVLSIRYGGDNRIAVLTDRSLHLYDFAGARKKTFDLEGDSLARIAFRDRETLLLLSTSDGQRLVLLNQDLEAVAEVSQQDSALAIQLGRDSVYVLRRDGVAVLSKMLEEKSFYAETGISNICLAGSRLYYFTPEEIRVLGQQEVEELA